MRSHATNLYCCFSASIISLVTLGGSGIAQETRGAQSPRGGLPILWDGEAGDNLWFNPMNWDPDGLPGMNDSVLIQIGGPVVAENQPIVVDSLGAQTGLSLQSSSLSTQSPSSIDGLITGGLSATIDSGSAPLDISGTSVFSSLLKWDGTGTTLGGDVLILGGFSVLQNAALTMSGDITVQGNTSSILLGGNATITGTLNMTSNSTLFSASNIAAAWVFDGGTIGHTGPNVSDVSDQFRMMNGSIFSDTGSLEFRVPFNVTGSSVSVSNGGTIQFSGLPGNNPFNTLHVTEISGDGVVNIFGSPTSIGSSTGLTTASVTGPVGLFLRSGIIIEDELSNTERMTIFGANITGTDGRLTAAGGVIDIQATPRINVETVVQSGGTILLTSPLNLDNTLRVNAGGTLELNNTINEAFNPMNSPKIDLGGFMNMPASPSVNSDINVPFHLLAGGSVLVEDRRLQLKDGGTIGNGTISLVDTAAAGFPTLGFNGDNTTSWVFQSDIEIANTGDHCELFIGNGFGAQPLVRIDAELTTNITGVSSFASIRVPTVLGSGTLVNRGALLFGSLTMKPDLFNFGELSFTSRLTVEGDIQNEPSGLVTQTGDLELTVPQAGELMFATNHGTWMFPGSARIKAASGGDPLAVEFSNQNIFHATAGTTTVETVFTNFGTVISDGATMIFDHATTVDKSSRRLLSGKWESRNNGSILFAQDIPTVITGIGTEVTGRLNRMPWLGGVRSVENGARVFLGDTSLGDNLDIVGSELEVEDGATVDSLGDILFTDDSLATVNPGATLEASGDLNSGNDDAIPSVLDNIAGVISLARGDALSPTIRAQTVNIFANLTPIVDNAGAMIVDADLVIHPTGALHINIGSAGANSSAAITGDLTIGGSVQIATLGGYTPTIGDSFVIATVDGTIGAHPVRAIGTIETGKAFGLSASGNDLVLTVLCAADLTGDGTLNIFDVLAFLDAFNTLDPVADFTGDGVFTIFDVLAFLDSFNAGCP